jgi:voltage-gated potassium channel
MNRLVRRLLLIAAAIVLTLLFGTVGFTVLERWPVFDAFYMTLITMTTVGYTEVHPLTAAGRIFNSFLIFFGVTTMFFAIGVMTQTIIEFQLDEFFDKRRLKKMIDNLQNHYIICGFGRVGRGAAGELQRAGVPFVIADMNQTRVEAAMRAGMLAVLADTTRDENLRDLKIASAKGLIAALATDADNLFLILSAKTLNPGLYIATRAGEEEAEAKLRRAGADAVFAPYSLAGHRLAQAMLRPDVVHFLDFTTGNIGLNVAIEQVRVSNASEFVSHSLKDMQIRRDLGVIVLAIRKHDGQMLFNPPAETEISGGDVLIVMGEQEKLRKLETRLAAQSALHDVKMP